MAFNLKIDYEFINAVQRRTKASTEAAEKGSGFNFNSLTSQTAVITVYAFLVLNKSQK